MGEERKRQFYEMEESRGEVFQKLNNMKNAESEYNAALYADCLAETNGDNIFCDQRQEEKYKDDARNIVKVKYENSLIPKMQTLEERITFMKDQNKYKKRVADVYSVYYNKYNDMKYKSQEKENKKNVNDRLADYYNSSSNNLKSLVSFLKTTYWIFVIIMTIIFIKKNNIR